MRLLSLRLRNFKSFEDETIELEPATVLVGPNSAGKTTIIEALGFLLDRSQPFRYSELSGNHGGAGSVAVTGLLGDLSDEERERLHGYLRPDGTVLIGSVLHGIDARLADFSRRDFRLRLALADYVPPAGDGGSDEVPDEEPERNPSQEDRHERSLDEMVRREVAKRVTRYGPREWDGQWWDSDSDLLLPHLITIPGPGAVQPTVGQVIAPIIEVVLARYFHKRVKRLKKDLGLIAEGLEMTLQSAVEDFGLIDALGDVAVGPDDDLEARLGALLGVELGFEGLRDADTDEDVGRDEATGAISLPPGAGASRAAAIAALALYGDPALWFPSFPVLIAIEEPEMGLHPLLQRRAARTLASMATFGVQTIITTHSPIFMDAAGAGGIRLVQRPPYGDAHVVSAAVREVSDALGVRPSDALLGEVFLVVEGPSDTDVLEVWARRLGFDLERAGVRMIAAEGATRVSVLSQLLSVAYQGTRIVALFDGDAEGQRGAADAVRVLGDRIDVRTLRRATLETYLSPRAIRYWARFEALKAGREETVEPDGDPGDALLRRTYHAIWSDERRYAKREHLGRIAEFMEEGEIGPEIVELLGDLTDRKDGA